MEHVHGWCFRGVYNGGIPYTGGGFVCICPMTRSTRPGILKYLLSFLLVHADIK